MSHKKLKTHNNYKQSFSARICDDLCEVLLSYLSIEDKMRCECVSKQFKRCVYIKQNVINLSSREFNGINHLNQLIKKCVKNPNDEEIDIKAFERVLKKCQFINELSITSTENNELVLKLITKYCHHLKKIRFDFGDINRDVLKQFALKCGPKLRSIHFPRLTIISIENYKLLLKSCPHLEEVFNVKIDGLFDGNQLLVTKLRKVERLYRINDKEIVQTFFNGCKNTLKFLHLDLEEVQYKNHLLREVSGLKSLQNLKFNLISDEEIDEFFAQNLKTIARECPELKSLELISYFISSILFHKIFNSFEYFTQIESLVITLIKSESLNTIESENELEEITVKSFKSCKKLTKLKIKIEANDNFFKDIDIHLPQLRHLTISIDEKMSDETTRSLAKLNNLKVIVFEPLINEIQFPLITDSGVCHIINNCTAIESIRLERGPNITHHIIDALIALAIRKPRIHFRHFFYSFYKIQPLIDLKTYQSLPNNMKLSITHIKLLL